MNINRSHRNPYDPAYPSCDRTAASLLIYPESRTSREITSSLGISPSFVQDVGERIVTSLGRVRVAKITYWELTSEYAVVSKDLRDHLNWLIEILLPRRFELRTLQASGDRMSIQCSWWSACGNGGPVLWPRQMKALAELNLECAFEIQFYPPDDDDG